MQIEIVTPPIPAMAIALQAEVAHWRSRAIESLPRAKELFQKQLEERNEDRLESARTDYERQLLLAHPIVEEYPFNDFTPEQFAISITQAIDILREMFRCWIADRSAFEVPLYSRLDDVLDKTLCFYNGNTQHVDLITGLFYAEVIDPIYEQIHRLMDNFIPAGTWDMWTTLPIKRGGFYLRKDGDFRVLEWQKLVADGIIDCPAKSKSQRRTEEMRELLVGDGSLLDVPPPESIFAKLASQSVE